MSKLRASKKSSTASGQTGDGPITFRARGDLILNANVSIPVQIVLPPGETCMALLAMTTKTPFGKAFFREAVANDQILRLFIGGWSFDVHVAAKADRTGRILIYAYDVLRGMSTPASSDKYDGEPQDAEAWRNA